MAQIKIFANKAFLTSTAKADVLKDVKKYRPKALLILDEDKEPVFEMGMTNGRAYCEGDGVFFNAATLKDGKATLAIDIPDGLDEEASIDWVTEKVRNILPQISKIEAALGDVSEEIEAETASVKAAISIAE